MKTVRLILAMMITVLANELQVNAQEEKEDEMVFFKVDTMPVYSDGMETFIKDITALVKYPEEALKQGLTGKVYVIFVVNKDGKIKDEWLANNNLLWMKQLGFTFSPPQSGPNE